MYMKNKTDKSKWNIKRIIDFAVPAVLILIALGAGIYIYDAKAEYQEAISVYEAIEEIAEIEYPEDMDIISDDELAEAESSQETEKKKPTFRNLNINFSALEEINPDVCGWLYIPIIKVSYPVVHSDDNLYYLKYTYDGLRNGSGSIFIDKDNNVDMQDPNTFIYGHNMKNDTMFGMLKELLTHKEWVYGNPAVYYYTKDHAYKYEIFAGYNTNSGSFSYYLSTDNEQLQNYIDKVQTVNQFEEYLDMDLKNVENIITLSTCAGVNSSARTVIHAYLADDYELDKNR